MTTIDGAPSIRVRAAGGFTMGAQNFDTVAEVQVLTTNYQAEYGRSSAGQLRMVTKSGTQSFRGNVFWSHQNDALDANTWTRKRDGLEKSPHRYNVYGFTLGGPIYIPGAFNESRQQLFFFWGQEWQRDRTVEEQYGDRTDGGDAQRRLQRAPGRRHSRSADRAAVSRERHPAQSDQPAGPGAPECVPATDPGIPAGREQLDRQSIDLQQPAQGQHQDRLGTDVESPCRRASHVGAQRLERSRAEWAWTRRSGTTPAAPWRRR